ncbi:MAG: alanine:cation symporter family protein [Burkholderiaceae bacterium]
MSLTVILMNVDQLGAAFAAIFDGAFSAEGVAGGFVGALIQGLKRATFSNEAGVGSASIAHSAVKPANRSPRAWSRCWAFIDTVVVCTMTALVIPSRVLQHRPYPTQKVDRRAATAASFQATFDWFPLPAGPRRADVCDLDHDLLVLLRPQGLDLPVWRRKTNELVYKLLFCFFVVVGCSIGFSAVIDFSDAAIFAMSIFNIIGLLFLMPVVKAELNKFLGKVQSENSSGTAEARPASGKEAHGRLWLWSRGHPRAHEA